jgi:hypothetical protein
MGHSQGTTQFLAGASLKPDYFKANIDQAVLLAPPIAMVHQTDELFSICSKKTNRDLLLRIADKIHLWSLLPYDYLTSGVAGALCELFDGKLCDLVIDIALGNNVDIDD